MNSWKGKEASSASAAISVVNFWLYIQTYDLLFTNKLQFYFNQLGAQQ